MKHVRVGIGVLVFNSGNQILLGQRLNSHGENSWAPPGGHLEIGESLEICAIREVYEETGLTIHNPKFLALTNDIFEKEDKHYISIFMKAYSHDMEFINKEPHKTLKWQWFDINNLPEPLFIPLQVLLERKGYGYAHELVIL